MKIIDINSRERECVRVYLDPHWPGFVTIDYESKNRPGYKHTEWYPVADFLAHNPTLVHLVKEVSTSPTPDLVSTVTKCGKLTLKDTTQKWQTNAYAGFSVWISRGQGEGQVRTVLKNSQNILTIDKPWDKPSPNQTSQYVLAHELGRSHGSRGNALPY